MPAVLREHFDTLVLVLVLVLASAVLVLGRAISPAPYLIVSGDSQSSTAIGRSRYVWWVNATSL